MTAAPRPTRPRPRAAAPGRPRRRCAGQVRARRRGEAHAGQGGEAGREQPQLPPGVPDALVGVEVMQLVPLSRRAWPREAGVAPPSCSVVMVPLGVDGAGGGRRRRLAVAAGRCLVGSDRRRRRFARCRRRPGSTASATPRTRCSTSAGRRTCAAGSRRTGRTGRRRQIAPMVAAIARIEAVACASRHEAAWLERNLLDAVLPPFNLTRGGQETAVHIALDLRPATPGAAGRAAGARAAAGRRALRAVSGRPAGAAGRERPAPDPPARVHGHAPRRRRAGAGTRARRRRARPRRAGRGADGGARARARRRGARPGGARARPRARRRGGRVRARRPRPGRDPGPGLDLRPAAGHRRRDPATLDVHGWADGVLVCFGVRGGRLCEWSQRRCSAAAGDGSGRGHAGRLAAVRPPQRRAGRRARSGRRVNHRRPAVRGGPSGGAVPSVARWWVPRCWPLRGRCGGRGAAGCGPCRRPR